MMHRKSRARAAATLALLVPLMGCQLIKKLTGRNDSGARTTAAPIGDAGGPSPVIALPNPTVAPLPTTAPPVPPAPTDGADDAAVAAATDAAAAPGDAPTVAVVDGGAVPTDLEGGRRPGGRYDNYCKDHPGRVHPRTRQLCPM